MKILLDIKDNKAAFFMELLKSFKFVKAEPLSEEKATLLKEIKESVEYMNLVKAGKAKARPAKEVLNEL
jgi:hypothetical protein